MNPEQIARAAMLSRMNGAPMPATTQLSGASGMQAPSPQVPQQVSMPQPNHQLGTMTKKPSPSDTLAKAVLPGTSHHDPHVQALSKVMIQKLIPYLGH